MSLHVKKRMNLYVRLNRLSYHQHRWVETFKRELL